MIFVARALAVMAGLLMVIAANVACAQGTGRKAALIIGNSSYTNTTSLANPANDAALIAASAKRAGFQTVTIIRDGNLQGLQQALRAFRTAADGADVAMVYYAGHGMEASGKNWMIPVDAKLEDALDLPFEALDLDRILESVSGAKLRMVVLDACRDNPFGRSWRSGTRSVSRGLAETQIDDILVIYAAAPGQTAADGTTGNSPFATSLAQRLVEPDLPVQLLGNVVRDDVLKSTGGGQRPYVSASITGTPIYLVPRTTGATAIPAPQPQLQAPQPAIDQSALDAITWQSAASIGTAQAYREYRKQFPNGRFVAMANQNIARLEAPSAPVQRPAPVQQRPAQVNTPATQSRPGNLIPLPSANAQVAPVLTLAERAALVIRPVRPAAPGITKRATPRGNPGIWISEVDYPARALREERTGSTGFRIGIGSDGLVDACEITISSGSIDLDQATCVAVSRRARFNPAVDGSGKPVNDVYSNRIRWIMPADPPPAAPATTQ